jgi:hypothetical protein
MTVVAGVVGKNENPQKSRCTKFHIVHSEAGPGRYRLEIHGGDRGASMKLPFNALMPVN